MKLKIIIALLLTFFNAVVCAQLSKKQKDSVGIATQVDYQQMLKAIGVSNVRPGPSGNVSASNPANIDESKATTYTSLPNPLIFKNGSKVNSSKLWTKRRLEILEDFDREIYGRVPKNIPKVKWKVISLENGKQGEIPVHIKRLIGEVGKNVNIELTLTTPALAKRAVPIIMEFGFSFPQAQNTSTQNSPDWKQQLINKGWGFAILSPRSIQADNGAGLTQGIIGLVNKGEFRKPEDWGALSAWAWGASRAMDYFETDVSVDSKKVGIEGVSRYGKAALVTMAYDERFAIAFIASSGQGGAKLFRRTFGEQIENVASSGEYHWMAGNYIKYAGPLTPNDFPVDAHHLIALCAPRPVFISCGAEAVEGRWVDAKGMFLGAALASPVYELLGKKGLGTFEFPQMETFLGGDLAFRQHTGGHTAGPNWSTFIAFAAKYFEK